MSLGIDAYLNKLRALLAGNDPATVQDALADAEEHLRTASEQALEADPGVSEDEALGSIIEQYGTPEEVAAAYQEIESRVVPPFAPSRVSNGRTPIQRFFGVLVEPRAYAALFFSLFSLITGVIYFTWAVTGISLSIGCIVMIFGLPLFGLFIFSIQGLALVEGRLIEAMLGVRMPRRAAAPPAGKGLWGRFVARLKDRRTWTTLFYLIIKMPLGVLSFSVFIVMLAYALELILAPALQYVFGVPFFVVDNLRFFMPPWLIPIFILAGFLDLIVILHLAKFVGRGYGALARAFLVQA
jgi:hypothetical protein